MTCGISKTLRRGLVAAALAATSFVASVGSAQERTPPPADRELERAAALLEQAAENGADRRTAAIVSGVATGAALVPIGAALALRSEDVPHTIGSGLLASSGGALFIAALSLPTSTSEQLYASLHDELASGAPADERLRRIELAWGATAASAASHRALAGTLETVFGAVFVAGGGVLVLTQPVLGLSQNRQYNVGSLLLGTGAPFLSFGIHSLFVRSPTEIAWSAYRAGKGGDARAPTPPLDLRVGSLGSGAALFASATF